MKPKRKIRSRRWWSGQLKKCEESGQSLAEYAKANDIKLGTFYKWKSILSAGKKSKQKVSPQTETAPNVATKLPFVEVTMSSNSKQMVTLESPQGWSLRVDSQISEETLSKLLRVVEGQS